MTGDREARLHDAVMSAAARDETFAQTGKRRDNLRAILAIVRVGWRLRRAVKTREDGRTGILTRQVLDRV
jgi:hypothetical protein